MKRFLFASVCMACTLMAMALGPKPLAMMLAGAGGELDATTDETALYEQYGANQAVWDSVFLWIASHDVRTMKAGKYYVCDSVMIRIMEGNTRAESRIEAHRNTIDLQWTLRGTEAYTLWSPADLTPNDEYDPAKDVQHFDAADSASHGTLVSRPQTVYLFFPHQPHQAMLCPNPSDNANCARPVRKVVAKIPYRSKVTMK